MTISTPSEARGPGAAQPWRRRSVLGLACGTALLALAPPLAAAADPRAFVADIGDRVLEILREEGKSDAEKLEALRVLLDANTDLDLVARLVLGRHWRAASADEQREYVTLFRQILMNTMAERMSDYEGQTFQVVGSTELSERDTAVQTRIVRTGGAPPLSVDWRIRESNGSFAIIDVIAEGVSLVVSQRNEVASIIERRGMSGLLETMRDRSGDGATLL